MGRKIRIKSAGIVAEAELNDTNSAQSIWDNLPIVSRANRWGEEIYFSIPVECPEENPREVVNLGDIAYWPPGKAFCIFFGPTPVSRGEEIRPASAVNVVGKILGDLEELKRVKEGEKIIIEKVEEGE